MEEIMNNDVIEVAAEEVVPAVGTNGLKVAGGIGLLALGAFAAYKFVIKPRLNKKDGDGVVDIPAHEVKEVKEDQKPEEETEE